MMQVFVKNSMEAVALYQKAFDAELLCAYPDGSGGYMHSELNAYGQILAVSEISEDVTIGNTMMFCFHLGEWIYVNTLDKKSRKIMLFF